MGTLAIVNPAAGQRAGARVWQHLREHLEHVREWDCATTKGPGHARELASRAVSHGYSRVVAVGGDGTIGEVASGLVHSSTALAIIPAGTGNDLSRNLGIPKDSRAAALLAAHGSPRPIDACELQTSTSKTYFVNVAGFGFDAEVAWRVNRFPKFFGGTLPYLGGVMQTLFGYRAPHVRLRVDGQPLDEPMFLVAVGNGASYGGGMRIVPDARPDDGLLDVCVVRDLSRLEVLRLIPRLYTGRHVGHPAVHILRCRTLSADATDRVLCQADGELVGELPARFQVVPAALQCVTGVLPGSPA